MALPTQGVMSLESVKSRVSSRNTELQNARPLDSWWMSCTALFFECARPTRSVLFSFTAVLLHYLLVLYLVNYAKEIILSNASSGFEPESPVQFRTRNWMVDNYHKFRLRHKALLLNNTACHLLCISFVGRLKSNLCIALTTLQKINSY
jgi:hypothetical protein